MSLYFPSLLIYTFYSMSPQFSILCLSIILLYVDAFGYLVSYAYTVSYEACIGIHKRLVSMKAYLLVDTAILFKL